MDDRVRVRVERAAAVAASPEALWEVIADVARWPEFKPFIRRTRVAGPLGMGARFRMDIAVKGPAVPVPVTVVEWDQPRRMAWSGGLPGLVVSTHSFIIEPADGGARLVSLEEFRGPLCRLMLVFVSEADLNRLHDRWLEAIKARAERPA